MRSQLALDTMNGTPIDYDAQVQDAYAALQAARAGKRPAATATPADTPASADTVPPPREPALKKRKGQDSAPVLPRKLFRMPSNLVPQERALPKMARVTLRPSVELGPDGRIQRVVISPGHRTPSPFGSRMGDHTVAWQAVVDAVRAYLFGRSPEEAVQALRLRQAEISGWMSEADSDGKKRLILLEDGVRRAERLEDSAYRVGHHLEAADAALTSAWRAAGGDAAAAHRSKALEELELAVAHHLAYVNYLPYATVPVPSSRGSKGSGEGTYRRIVLDAEAPGSGIDQGADVDDFAADDVEEASGAEDEDGEDEEGAETEDGEGEGEGAEDSGDSPGPLVPSAASSEEEEEPSDRPVVVVEDPALRLRNALWKLFSFEAALRAARTRMALEPETADNVTGQHAELEQIVADILVQLDYNVRPVGAKSPDRRLDLKRVDALSKSAAGMRDQFKGDPDAADLHGLASFVVDTARRIRDTTGQAGPSRTAAKQCREKLGQLRTPAQAAAETMVENAAAALPNAAMVLAYLLHDHQLTMATAYPQAVRTSGFLVPRSATAAAPAAATPTAPASAAATPTAPAPDEAAPATGPCAAALEELRNQIGARSRELPHTPEDLTKLMKAVRKSYEALTPEPVAGDANGWATHRAAEALVVTYTRTPAPGAPTLTVNGRAPAPRGVAGMGSHTTAWLVEVAAADTLAAVCKEVVPNFRRAVAEDLRSDVMRLDCLLPSDQLRGGQLRSLFNTAAEVMEATEERKAAALYLRFRNLLPYATVDAGSRGGHDEDLTQPSIVLFDAGSLRQAAELHATTLSKAEDRAAVAKDLATLSVSLLKRADPRWGNHQDLRLAVSACSRRLDAQSKALQREEPKNVAEIILGTRWREHERAYALAARSRMVLNATAAKAAKPAHNPQ